MSDVATDPIRADAAFDLYAWKSPSDLDDDRADRLLASWDRLLASWRVLIGGFMVAMAIYTFVHEGRKAIKRRRTRAE